MADSEAKGKAFMEEADRKLKSATGFFGNLFGGTQKQEDACELYGRAANSFKIAKKWNEAGKAFCCNAEIRLRLESRHEAATAYVDAGNCYKKSNPQEAVKVLLRAIEIYIDMGRFTIAAKNHISIAEIYENEMIDLEKAVENYERAADYYRGEDSNSAANKCSLKVAMYAAQLEDYEKATTIYEMVAKTAMENTLLKYSAKDYFFKGALCHMCVDVLNAQLALTRYDEMFPTFIDSREHKLLNKLLDAIEEQNVDAYTDAVKDYDSVSRLDQWLTTILLRIKKSINEDPDLR